MMIEGIHVREESTQIDFVIAWVDGGDAAWCDAKQTCINAQQKRRNDGETDRTEEGIEDKRDERFRDWGLLKYWFRGVEQYAPWVHKIYFVTWGHLPKWLDTTNPKLEIVSHKDYIPAEFLPTFNSHTIELNLHRIKGLSEQFVYFNDDVFLLKAVRPEHFFKNGLPCDMLALQPVVTNAENPVMPYIYLNNAMVLAKYFKKRENMKKHPGNYFHVGYPLLYFGYNVLEMVFPRFTGFYTVHGAAPLRKETYRILWEKEEGLLKEVCHHPFRDSRDVNQYLLREWQKLSGMFVPTNVHRLCSYFNVSADTRKLTAAIEKQSAAMICINDADETIDFERAKGELIASFEKILPERSSFEL